MARSPTLVLAAMLFVPFLVLGHVQAAGSATHVSVSKVHYDLLPLGDVNDVAHFSVVLTVSGGSTSSLTVKVQQAGLGAGTVGGSYDLAGALAPGQYAIDIYQSAPGAANQVCASASGADATGAHIETPDGSCSGITTVAGLVI